MKKNFIVYFSTLAQFEWTNDELKFNDKAEGDVTIPNDILEMFSIYLDIIGKLIQNSNLIVSDKLLNESYVVCNSFLEIIRFVVTYLFTFDFLDKNETVGVSNIKNNNNNITLTVSTRKVSLKKSQKLNITNFLKEIDNLLNESKSNLTEKYKFFVSISLTIVNYFISCSLFYHKIIKQENLDKLSKDEKESSRYWICSIRDFLKILNTFIETNDGFFYNYVREHGSFIRIKTENYSLTTKPNYQTAVPLNFPLTKAILHLFQSVFDFSDNLSIIVNESTSLDLIRMHYICFIKLYNKNLDLTAKIGDLNRLLENCPDKNKRIKQLIKDIYNDTNTLNLIICLCKMHLRCLFSMAKNRNSDVTNKFFQLRIVEVLVRELDLEHEANENSRKLKKYYESCKNTDKDQKDKLKVDSLIREKAQSEIDRAINTKLENIVNSSNKNEDRSQTSTPVKELSPTKESNQSPPKDPNAKFKGIFAHKFKPKPKVEEKPQISNEEEVKLNEEKIVVQSEISQSPTNNKKNPFTLSKKPVIELNMGKIASTAGNHDLISMMDKTKTPVFNVNMNLGENFSEMVNNQKKDELENISERKENASSRRKSSERESFNEDDEEFDDIPLCEHIPKDERYKNKIPKLHDLNENNIPMETLKEEKKDKPKVSFKNDFSLKLNQKKKESENNAANDSFSNNLVVEESKITNLPEKETESPKKEEPKKDPPKTNFAAIFKNKKLPFTRKEEPKEQITPPETQISPEKVISKRGSNFNFDDEEFDDIPLCENLKASFNHSIPKLDIQGKGKDEIKEEKKTNLSFNKSKTSSKEIVSKKAVSDDSFNEDDEEFDDIPLCENLPKNKKFELPKLQIKEDNIEEVKKEPHHSKNKSNTDIVKVNSVNPIPKSSMKTNLSGNKSGILTEFSLGEVDRQIHNHERKKSMPQNALMSLEDDKKLKKASLFNMNPKDQGKVALGSGAKKPIVPVLNFSKTDQNLNNNNFNDLSKDKSDNKSRDIDISDINKIDKSMRKNIPKLQLILDKITKKKYRLLYKNKDEVNEEDIIDATIFYNKERANRLLYHDTDLHVLIISIVVCLILTPTRGTLEELYCSDYPLENGKINIFYLLHHHINHKENGHILPKLLRMVAEIKPFGVGQRLLKLLHKDLFDSTIFTQWTKVAAGAYGTVYQCQTNVAEPTTVAVKKMAVSENIFDRCRIHDIFTEITALETFRMEGCVTHLFDFGVDSDYYYIVMKMYPYSLRRWRLEQKGSFNEMLPFYLNIFKDILKAISIIHNYKTTHYDIKCDNILLDFHYSDSTPVSSISQNEENNMTVKIADFGECKMFINEQDEYCTRNRGTECIKSPEMLNLGYNIRRDDDKFDRRKKIGTNRSSDIWSIGCLFYELLTGKYLFEEEITNDYFVFINKLNSPQTSIFEIITEEKVKELNSNIYITDFLKFMLVKDPQSRPNIKTILSRYDHVHALLVSLGNPYSSKYLNSLSKRVNNNIDTCFEQCLSLMEGSQLQDDLNEEYNSFGQLNNNLQYIPNLIKITEDIYVCDINFAEYNIDVLLKLGVTHVISLNKTKNKDILDRFLFFNLLETNSDLKKPAFYHIHKTLDFLRHCMIYRGSALFLDDYQNSYLNAKQTFLIRDLVILTVSFILNLSAYDAWTYINSKILFFWVPSSELAILSQWVLNESLIISEIYSYPILKCLCGGCVIVLNRNFNNVSNIVIKTCNCSSKNKNTQLSECPSHGCYDYIQNIKNSYGLNYEYLQWGSFNAEDFFVGPGDLGKYSDSSHKRIIFSSRGIDENTILHSVNEKKLVKFINKVNSILIEKSSWNLYKCKICQIWMYAENCEKFYVLINNFYNATKKIDQKKKLLKSNHLKNLKLSKLL